MQISDCEIRGVKLISPVRHLDKRGFFMETFNRARYAEAGIDFDFVQDNLSSSTRGTVRGLHYQLLKPQGKLVYVIRGEIFDVAVDIRRGSPTFGRWAGYQLTAGNYRQLFVGPGLAHGFMVLSPEAEVYYKCTDLYNPGDEYGVLWNDPDIDIEWPDLDAIVSEKDLGQPRLAEIDIERLPLWTGSE